MKKLLIIRYAGDLICPFDDRLVERITKELDQDLVLTLHEPNPKQHLNYPYFEFIKVG